MINLVGVGVGGSSKVICDIINQYPNQYKIIGWFDDDLIKIGTTHLGSPVLDKISNIYLYKHQFDQAFISIGATSNTSIRDKVFSILKVMDIPLHTVVSKNAIISPTSQIDEGNIILDRVIINADTNIGKNNFFNTGCIIEHDCTIKNSCFISPNATLCGNVVLNNNCFIGANSVLLGNSIIGENCTIGAGCVLLNNAPPNTTFVGNPGKLLK